jgi:hypothetical protein
VGSVGQGTRGVRGFPLSIDHRRPQRCRWEPIEVTAHLVSEHATPGVPVPVTIDWIFTAFLTDQNARLAPSTYRRYAEVIDLFRASLNGYGHQNLDREERRLFEHTYDAGDEEAFVHLFGPEQIVGNVGEFLGYFMVRKVICGEELLRAAGTVTKKLAAWLGAHGHISGNDVADAIDRGTEAARDLPRADRLGRLLHHESQQATLDPQSFVRRGLHRGLSAHREGRSRRSLA